MPCEFLSNILKRLGGIARTVLAPALFCGLLACGGGGSGTSGGSNLAAGSCSASTCGTAMITLTDATGDFTSYTVDVTSISLTKADGTVVETLPATTRVDFTQLVDLSELVSANTIPPGEYVAATMTVDYTNAAIFVEVNGAPVQASVVDGSGNPPGAVTLNVKLDDAHHLFINAGAISRLALDFNLTASNSVNTSAATPVVTVQPFVVASIVPSDTRDIRVRGALASVDTTAETYTVNVRPFDNQTGSVGQVTVNTTATTTFEVNGTPATGPAGITAMNALAAGAWTVAFGSLSTTDHTFTATRVLAGTSVVMPSMDGLVGVVTARTQNTLTVRGATLWSHSDGDDHFSARNVTLTIGDATAFTVAGQPNAMPTVAWPSVGSAITAFGTSGTDASGNPTFDATAGRVRLEITTLWGFPTATASGQVTVDVQSIMGLQPSEFSFAGTGTSSASDSNPAAYVVTTGTLPAPTVSTTSPIRYIGLVQPFGSAPPDFNANTAVDFANDFAKLDVGFGDGSATAFTTVGATDLVLNLADPNLGGVHVIQAGPLVIDLTKLAASPSIIPDTTAQDLFAIESKSGSGPSSLSVYQSYSDFETALTALLAGTAKVTRVLALGHYDQTANTFTATQIAVLVKN